MLKYHSLSAADIASLLEQEKIPAFRARQLQDWVYSKSAGSFREMNNLPLVLRTRFEELFDLEVPEGVRAERSSDGTCKYVLKLSDGNLIECVYLPYSDRRSVCVSSQVGCPVGCVFCASCENGYVRDLTPGEIVNQLLYVQRENACRVTHVVFMGIGEPLLNLDNVEKAAEIINKEMGISRRRITVSTSGIIKGIRALADKKSEMTLALSLHSPFQEQRETLIPAASANPLPGLTDAADYYFGKTGRRITLEYLLIDGVNDSIKAANALAALAKRLKAHVNLIPYNKVEGKPFRRPPEKKIKSFENALLAQNVQTTRRAERGSAKAAACGQLRYETSSNTKKENDVCFKGSQS